MWPTNPRKKIKLQFGSSVTLQDENSPPRNWFNRENGYRSQRLFLKLNDDCLAEIFRFVPIVDLVSVAQTSVRLNATAKHFFARKRITYIFGNATNKTAIQARKLFATFGAQMFQLDIDFRSCGRNAGRIMDAVIRYCAPSLKRLKLKAFEIPDTREAFTGMAKLFQNLHTLHLEDVMIENMCTLLGPYSIISENGNVINFFANCKDLVNLSLIDTFGFNRAILDNPFPKLENFVATPTEFDGEYLEGFVLRHKNLKSFSVISNDPDLYDIYCLVPALKVIADNCQDIRRLAFGLGIFDDLAQCKLLLQSLLGLPKLRELKILLLNGTEPPNLSNTLEVLDIEFDYANPDFLPMVFQLPKLRSLRLRDVGAVGRVDIKPLSNLTNLETLSIEVLVNAEFKFLFLVNCLVKLTKLKFHVNNFKIGNETYQRLLDIVEGRPNARNRFLEIDCRTTSNFIDLKRAAVKFTPLE